MMGTARACACDPRGHAPECPRSGVHVPPSSNPTPSVSCGYVERPEDTAFVSVRHPGRVRHVRRPGPLRRLLRWLTGRW
jgi:hypothetical protein